MNSPRRRSKTQAPVPGRLPSQVLPAGLGRIYGLGLLLLVMVFFMLTFRGRPPRALERVFAPVAADPETVAARRQEVANLQGGAWLDPRDGAGFAETPGYRRLLQMLIDHVRPGDVVEDPPLFDYQQAMLAPDLQRAKVVKVKGTCVEHWAQKLDQPVFQVTDVWRVVVTDGTGEDGMYVDVIEQPPALIARRSQVEIVGQFYRVLRYQTVTGETRDVPYLLARSLRVVTEEAPASAFNLSDPANIVLLVAVAGMLAWGCLRVIYSRRRPVVRWRAPHLHSTLPHSPES